MKLVFPTEYWPSRRTMGLASKSEATMVEPDGETGRAFLTFGNYRAILRYNCANFYAVAVGRLADLVKQ